MKQGEAFNISKVWPEVKIPLGMLRDRSISFCAKMIYGLLVRYAGSAGYCSVRQQKIAYDLDTSKALVKKGIKSLKDQKYIITKLQGTGKPAIYYFLWRNDFKLETGGVHRININPEIHKNILEYFKDQEKKSGEQQSKKKKKGSSAGEL